jgi:hypothetical protein
MVRGPSIMPKVKKPPSPHRDPSSGPDDDRGYTISTDKCLAGFAEIPDMIKELDLGHYVADSQNHWIHRE